MYFVIGWIYILVNVVVHKKNISEWVVYTADKISTRCNNSYEINAWIVGELILGCGIAILIWPVMVIVQIYNALIN